MHAKYPQLYTACSLAFEADQQSAPGPTSKKSWEQDRGRPERGRCPAVGEAAAAEQSTASLALPGWKEN